MKRSITFSNSKIYNLANSDKLLILRTWIDLVTEKDMTDYGLSQFLNKNIRDPYFKHYMIPEHMINSINIKKEI